MPKKSLKKAFVEYCLKEKFEKNRSIKQILITSNTTSSSGIISKLNLKKTIHQFFPIDTKLKF